MPETADAHPAAANAPDDADELDGVAAAAVAVAKRLRDESLE